MQTENHDTSSEWIYSSLREEPDFADLLTFYVDELPGKRTTLHDLAKVSNYEGLRREAHNLRGSAGGYGFQGLSDLAGRLEDSCKITPRDETTILRNLDEILDYLQKVRV